MSEELDRRAALAMGWRIETDSIGWEWCIDKDGTRWPLENWSPSADRNDLAELLREVERRRMGDDLARKMRVLWMGDGRAVTEWPINDYTFWIMTLNPSRICESACEVLEAENETN